MVTQSATKYVTVLDIALMLRVTPADADVLTRSEREFPLPVTTSTSGRMWRRAEVERWARKAGRLR